MDFSTPPQYTSLANALVSMFGNSVAIAHTDRMHGGDINKAYALTLNTGDRIFMKANAKENVSFFTAEAAGLSAIAATQAIATPPILCTGTDDGEEVGYSFLLLKFIESSKKRTDYYEAFARELAAFHSADTTPFVPNYRFGFFQDNFIGARFQDNTPSECWIPFFRDRRLAPQFKTADAHFSSGDHAKITRLLDHLDEFLVEPEKPSLLHGDLWGGNVLCGADGKAMLIDPAAYVGHAEADLAMTELFGGFSPAFHAAYREVRPLQAGYEDRRDLYNLYHLLNHLNMFGTGYLGAVLSIVDEYVG
jgi:fructosamine-3-kinase